MKDYISKPYIQFWVIAIILILLSINYLRYEDAVIDINVHDTYFIIHNSHIFQFLAFVYAIIGLSYWIILKPKLLLYTTLLKIHTYTTILIIPLYFIGYFILNTFFISDFPLFDETDYIQIFVTSLISIFLILQVLYILNILFGLITITMNKN